MAVSTHHTFTITTFDPDSMKWNRWVQKLEGDFQLFKTEENEKAHYLLHYCGHDGYDKVCDDIAPESPYSKTYEQIKAILEKNYNTDPVEIMEVFNFHNRKQNEGESIQDFMAALRKLSVNCSFGIYKDIALRNQFVCGLRSEKIQGKLLEKRELTLQSAIDSAAAMESSMNNAAQIHRNGNSNFSVNYVSNNKQNKLNKNLPYSNNKLSAQNNTNHINTKIENNNSLKCYRCGNENHLANKCGYKNSICSFCNIKGHIVSVCTKKKNSKPVNHIESCPCEIRDLDIFKIEKIDSVDYHDKIWLEMIVEDVPIVFEVDTGSPVTIINLDFKNKFFPNQEMISSKLDLITYCKTSIDVRGFIEVTGEYDGRICTLPLYVVNSDRHPLIGREWIRKYHINIMKFIKNEIHNIEIPKNTDGRLKILFNDYKEVFATTIGHITDIQAKIHLKDGTKPVFCKARPVPFSLKPKIEAELDNLLENNILVKVDHSDWATPLVTVLKPNGSVRICGDYKITINPNIMVDKHPLPTIDELFTSMSGGDKFSKIDLTKAYLQLEVRKEDRYLLTLNTHKGLFEPSRLMYGLSSAPAIWQREIEIILQGILGVTVFLDDIKITGPDDKTHLDRLKQVLARLHARNIRVNLEKCEFFSDSIQYCGYVIDRNGIHKVKGKIDAIQNMPRPKNVDEIRSFVGLINYYGRFLKNLSTTIYPLNNLLKKENPFLWNSDCEEAFNEVKVQMQSDVILAHYDPHKKLVLATDASCYGVGAVLSHIDKNGVEQPIQFASQTLSKTQQKYTQIDKEAYGIIFGVQKFTQYLFGRKFILQVDNKPLVQILSPNKDLPNFTAMRMQHYALFLRIFDYDIKFRDTKSHANADAFSRLPTLTSFPDDQFEATDIVELCQIETLPVHVKELGEITTKDQKLKSLLQGLRTGREVAPSDRFNINQNEFALQEDCLMRGSRVYIPEPLRKRVLDELHSTHFGVVRMKSLARSYFWWENLDSEIELLAKNCSQCQLYQSNPVKVPVHRWDPPSKPFERVHVDFAGPIYGIYLFVLVCAYSKWPEVHIMKNITTAATITVCRKIFSCFGLPMVFVSDHGTQFTSGEFQDFLKKNGIIHKMGAPYHPATNGQAERYVRTIKEKLKNMDCSKTEVELYLSNILLNYRKTVHPATGKSPALMIFNRDVRSRLDMMIPTNSPESHNTNLNPRSLLVGTRVSVREYLHRDVKWRFGNVMNKVGDLHYDVKLDDGRIWRRHIDQIREIGMNTPIESEADLETYIPNSEPLISPVSSDNKSQEMNPPNSNIKNSTGIPIGEYIPHEMIQSTSSPLISSQDSQAIESCNSDENNYSKLRRSTRIKKPIKKLDL